MPFYILLVFFLIAAGSDLLGFLWHSSREQGHVVKGTALAMVLELLGWIPIWFALQYDDIRIAVASVVGSGVGTAVGLHLVKRRVKVT